MTHLACCCSQGTGDDAALIDQLLTAAEAAAASVNAATDNPVRAATVSMPWVLRSSERCCTSSASSAEFIISFIVGARAGSAALAHTPRAAAAARGARRCCRRCSSAHSVWRQSVQMLGMRTGLPDHQQGDALQNAVQALVMAAIPPYLHDHVAYPRNPPCRVSYRWMLATSSHARARRRCSHASRVPARRALE